MDKKITFRGMDHSAEMEKYANAQLENIINFLADESPVVMNLVLEPSKVHAHHKIELRINTPRFNRISHYEGPDFYDTLDRVIDTMYRELLEDKQRALDDRKMVGRHAEFKKQR